MQDGAGQPMPQLGVSTTTAPSGPTNIAFEAHNKPSKTLPALTQPAWALTPSSTSNERAVVGAHTKPVVARDFEYMSALNTLGVSADDAHFFKDPVIRKYMMEIVKSVSRVICDGQGNAPQGNTEEHLAPRKRARSDKMSTDTAIEILFTNPPEADMSHVITPPDAEEEERAELIREALSNVVERIKGRAAHVTFGPRQAKPCEKTTNAELRAYLDYDAGLNTEGIANESLEARNERTRLEKHIWTSYREAYEAELEAIARSQAEARGQVYINGGIERRNTMYNVGVIWPRVFCYTDTNTVFYGPLTIAVVKHLMGYSRRAQFNPPQDDRVYYTAPGGYPQTVNELIDLIALCKQSDVEAVYRVGAHILVRSFYQSTRRIDPSLHDDVMKAVLDPHIYNPEDYPACAKSANVDMEIDALPPRERGRQDGANGGYGLFTPTSPFDVMGWGTYFVVHHSTGSTNSINGIIMDYGGAYTHRDGVRSVTHSSSTPRLQTSASSV